MVAKTNVTEVAPDTYQISTFHPEYGIQLNRLLIEGISSPIVRRALP